MRFLYSRIHHLRLGPVALGALALTLSACATPNVPTSPCCYQGEVTLARADNVYLALDNGEKLTFANAFPGFEPRVGLLAPQLPFFSAEISLVNLPSLPPVLTQYDANADGFIQEPELVVLYIREAALGLGHAVNHLGVNPRTDALVLPGAEISGLIQFIDDNFARMTPDARTIFQDLVFLGQQVLIEATIVRDTSL